MNLSFKQYHTLVELAYNDEVTEDILSEIFGWSPEEKKAKAQKALAALQARKKGAQTNMAKAQAGKAQAKNGLDAYMQQNLGKPATQKAYDKVPSAQLGGSKARAAERDWVASLAKEEFVNEKMGGGPKANPSISYKGYTFQKQADTGSYHVKKGPTFVGHAKDHQEAITKADKHAETNEGFVIEGKSHYSFHAPVGKLLGTASANVDLNSTSMIQFAPLFGTHLVKRGSL